MPKWTLNGFYVKNDKKKMPNWKAKKMKKS